MKRNFISFYSEQDKIFKLHKGKIFIEIPKNITIDNFILNNTNENRLNYEMLLQIDEFGDSDYYYIIYSEEKFNEKISISNLLNSNEDNIGLFLEGFQTKNKVHIKNI